MYLDFRPRRPEIVPAQHEAELCLVRGVALATHLDVGLVVRGQNAFVILIRFVPAACSSTGGFHGRTEGWVGYGVR
jgi:hypothetical protein